MSPRAIFPATAIAAALLPGGAAALPRFAVRTGQDCSACHVNPTGGGMRSAYGRNVFARQYLSLSGGPAAAGEAGAGGGAAGEAGADEPFGAELNRHLALGADLRTGYLMQKQLDPAAPRVSTQFTPQADLYLHAQLDPRLGFYLDKGAYSGFESFALWRPLGAPGDRDLYVKVGRFVLPFGVREVNHTIWTREAVGMGPADRDHGVEVGGAWGRLSGQAAVANGTYGDAFFDASGSHEAGKRFDKAVAGRLVFRARAGPLSAWHGASVLYNDNVTQQNPLFAPALFPPGTVPAIALGVNEWRAAAFLGLALGRLSFTGEVAGVRDVFAAEMRTLTGYASYQELSVQAVQGLDLSASYEFADPDLEFARGRIQRIGAFVEVFPLPHLEVRLMGRRATGPATLVPGGASAHDMEILVHAYF